ncbi:MAG: helix-turn-helix domain-containing protein [Alicyclobacillus macrosporangiidus]|uniref:helix-turn-helix domain-containing protein n=1 Tax=Alicyclobacillus macrosporangiidus TaxID=392015 RepID=UPI0026ED2B87|nr:helix-turn-helix domain-containing protein [Alicyclobacillus macrosporangiidus]MCL6599820.1 helix-turn-helix domain-containing protein [Alicyclobacillus macrosporangiidus]
MPKAGNMLSVLWLLHLRKRITAAEIAKELEISIRTVYRCIHGRNEHGLDQRCPSLVPPKCLSLSFFPTQ